LISSAAAATMLLLAVVLGLAGVQELTSIPLRAHTLKAWWLSSF
jgi:hypothetical protein